MPPHHRDPLFDNPRLASVLCAIDRHALAIVEECELEGDDDVLVMAFGLIAVGTTLFHSPTSKARVTALVDHIWSLLDCQDARDALEIIGKGRTKLAD